MQVEQLTVQSCLQPIVGTYRLKCDLSLCCKKKNVSLFTWAHIIIMRKVTK